MPSRRLTIAAVAAVAAVAPPAAQAAKQQPPSWLKVQDGVTQPQFSLDEAIEETVFVQTRLDTDRDGRRDRLRIQISRPRETKTRGIDVPVIFEHSPYRGDFGDSHNHDVDVDALPQDRGGHKRAAVASSARARVRGRSNLPGSLDNDYVPRGYAVVLGESIGTFGSDGCPDIGGPAETLGTKAVIDWLNGRAKAFDAAGNRVRADWTTGAVGMTGVSYNGTLPNQVATTGVRGLKTIVPVSAISSWYDYYRANGLVVAPHSQTSGKGDNDYLGEDTDVLADFIAKRMKTPQCERMRARLVARQDRETGDWSSFWRARDYLRRVKHVRASVFAVHGLNDFNVKTKAFAAGWQRLSARGVPRKLWLHNGGHGPPTGAGFNRTVIRWFDHWLFGVQNGITTEPRVHIQREDGTYHDEADWPAPGAQTATLRLAAADAHAPGALGTAAVTGGPKQSFVDRGRELDTDDALITDPDAANPNRLIYRSPALTRDVRMSGTPWVDLRMSIDNRNAANLTAVLVDLGPTGDPAMVTRGWLDPQNRNDVAHSQSIAKGRAYSLHWDLQPDDHVFAAGHRIGLVVVSTDHDYTLRPKPGTELTLDPSGSDLQLPIVGGAAALGF
jgi:X-Pro dipeptidyl-peptidase